MKLKNALLSLTALVIAAPFAFAQTTVSTEPIGFITVDIVGDGGTSLIAPGMVSPLEFQGVVTGATGNDVAVNATLEVDAYAGTHYLEVFEGTNAGALSMIVSNTADTFTTSDALTVAADDVVRVRAFMTPGTIFGNGADAGFAADGTDIMLIWDAAAQSPTIVLWDSASARWEDFGGADRTNFPIYPDEGILVQKGSAGDISVRVVGAVKIGSSGGATYSGTTISANPYPVDITLAETGIESALGATDGTDIVLLWDADAQAPSGLFFHNGTNWQDFGGANQDGAVVPAGAAILISRGTTEALNWSAAQPF